MRYNPSAPDHRSLRCRDRANTYSQVPMERRMYNHGQRINPEEQNSTPPASSSVTHPPGR